MAAAEYFDGLGELATALEESRAVQEKSQTTAMQYMVQMQAAADAEVVLGQKAAAQAQEVYDISALLGDATVALTGQDSTIEKAEFDNVFSASARIYDISAAAADRIAVIRDEFDTESEALQANLKTVQETEALGMLDFLKDPMNTLQSMYKAKQAKDQLPYQMEQLRVLDDQQRMHTSLHQAEVGTLKERALAKQRMNERLYYDRIGLKAQVDILNSYKTVEEADLSSLKDMMGFSASNISNIRSAVAVAMQQGDLSVRAFQNILEAEKAVYSKTTMDMALKAAEKDETVMASLDSKMELVNDTLGTEYVNFQEFVTARQAGVVPDDVAFNASQIFNKGVLGATQTLSSANPVEALINAASAGENSWITPELMAITGRYITDTNASGSLDAAGKETAINSFLNGLVPNSQADIDNLYSHSAGVLQIWNPAKMDFRPGYWDTTAAPLQVSSIPILQKLDISATSFEEFSKTAIRRVLGMEGVSLEQAAEALASVSKYQLKATNSATGFGLTELNTKGLGLPGIETGNAANPAHWLRALQYEKMRQTQTNPLLSPSRQGQYQMK